MSVRPTVDREGFERARLSEVEPYSIPNGSLCPISSVEVFGDHALSMIKDIVVPESYNRIDQLDGKLDAIGL
jgi:hypothetical protein